MPPNTDLASLHNVLTGNSVFFLFFFLYRLMNNIIMRFEIIIGNGVPRELGVVVHTCL